MSHSLIAGSSYPATTPDRVRDELVNIRRAIEELRIAITGIQANLVQLGEILHRRVKPFLTVAEVAEIADVHPDTVRRWIRQKKLQATRVKGTGPKGRLLIDREALDTLVRCGLAGDIPATAFGVCEDEPD